MAPAEDDISIAEKRVYAGRAGRTDAYVASDVGLVRVAISGDKIGSFGLVTHEAAADVAILRRNAEPAHIAIATDTDLLVAPLEEGDEREGRSGRDLDPSPVGLGSTVAVGVHGGDFIVAGDDGGLARFRPNGINGEVDGNEGNVDGADPAVERLGSVFDPRAIDGPLIAAGDGIHRVVDRGSEPTVEHVGLDDVRDVAGAGVPLAATPEGLYWLGNGWMEALDRSFHGVVADGDGHAMAAAGTDLYVHDGPAAGSDGSGSEGPGNGTVSGWDAGTWRRVELPVEEEAVALGYGTGLSVVVTAAGTLCVDAGDGWRQQAIGVRGIGGVSLRAAESR